jgi:hypothetical protein
MSLEHGLSPAGTIFGRQPQAFTLGEFFRKVGEDVGEYLAVPALRSKDAGNYDVLRF